MLNVTFLMTYAAKNLTTHHGSVAQEEGVFRTLIKVAYGGYFITYHTHLGGGIAGGKCDIFIFRCNSDITRCKTFHML